MVTRVIPKEITANELLIDTEISNWLFQLMTTNFLGYWILQLSKDSKCLALLLDLESFNGFCTALKKCIDGPSNSTYSAAQISNMYEIAASELSNPFNDDGAISILSNWESDPYITLNFYNNSEGVNKLVIRQSLYIPDAMQLYNLLASVYNNFPDKLTWTPKFSKNR